MKADKRPETVPSEAIWDESDQDWGVGKENKEGVKIGEWNYWLPDGRLYLRIVFDEYGEEISETYFPPAHVPKDAVWDEDDMEWGQGERNEEGDEIGEWKWWLAPTGHLCCHTFFDNEGNMESAKRYHPNGEIAMEMSYNSDGYEIRNYYRCTQETEEYFPDEECKLKGVWKASRKVGVSPLNYNFYNKSGELLDRQDVDFTRYVKGPDSETAIQAIRRYEKVIKTIQKEVDITEDFEEDLELYWKPYFYKQISEDELQKHEISLGIVFPPSYKEFVVKYGLLIFGKESQCNRKMFLDYETMTDALKDYWNIDVEKEDSIEAKERLNKVFIFSTGDESLQSVYYHCLDFNTLNKETGEVSIVNFNQDEWGYFIEDERKEMCNTRGFDKHIRILVDEAIDDLLSEIE
ncbi:SMI1/KNR4 family protein [Aquimarina aquimarini]|uniref:SMI1/KNR4 family protein n=1 Tax=Aquimarina aquimarini TaxID=1191734 RepID=UPI000D551F95|nr:SMI1/KNR4 family protein [Aquimarina aquimarini]